MVDIKKSVVSGEDVTIRVAGHVALHGDSNTERTGIGTTAPARTLHLRSGDAVPLRIESTSAASPGIELRGTAGSGLIGYDQAAGITVGLGSDARPLSPSDFDASPTQPRIVRNILDRDEMIVDAFTASVSGDGALANADDKMSFTATTAGTGGRAWYSETFTAAAGQAYALSFRVSGMAGAPTNGFAYLADAPDAGEREANVTSNGRWCIRFSYTSGASTSFRLGLGCQSDENGAVSAAFSEWMLEEVESVTDAPSEYTPPGLPSAFGYANGNSVSSGSVTEVSGAAIDYRRPRTAVLIGDSFSNGHTDIPFQVADTHPSWALCGAGTGGRKLEEAVALVPAAMSRASLPQQIISAEYIPSFVAGRVADRYVIAALGINDVVGNATASEMQAHAQAFASAAWSVDDSVTVVLCTVTPFGNSVSYSAGRESVRVAYNSWLRTYAKANRLVRVFDAAALVQDSGDAKDLAAAYDSGDGLHPNQAGTDLIAAALGRELERAHSAIVDATVDGVSGATIYVDRSSGRLVIGQEDGAGGRSTVGIDLSGSGGACAITYDSSTGKITFGADLSASVLSVPDGGASSARIEVGTGGDLKIYHNGSQNLIVGSGETFIGSSDFTGLSLLTNGVARMSFTAGGAATLTKGLTVNTTAASSALAVADGTSITTLSTSATCGASALRIDQNDTDEPFVNFDGTSAASSAANISTWTTGATLTGYVRIAINGTDYWMPYYTAPTS